MAANVPLGDSVSRSPFLGESFKQVSGDVFAKDWGLGRDFLVGDGSLRHIILDRDDIVENVAATPLDKVAPTIDLLLSSDNLYAETTASSPTVIAQ